MSATDKIALAALAIAVCAALGAFWQGHLARQHNHLVVKPLLDLDVNRIVNPGDHQFVVVLRNAGVGPALIFDRYFTVQDRRYTSVGTEPHAIREILQQLLGTKFNWQLLHKHGLPGKATVMLPNAEQVLVHVVFPGISVQAFEVVSELLSQVGVHVGYKSLYGHVQWLHRGDGEEKRES